MRRAIQALGLFLLPGFFFGACRAPSPGEPLRLRVLSYNIRHGVGMDGRLDLDRQARVIRRISPDLVALQEVDQGTKRSGGRREAEVLGRKAGLHGTFGKAMDFDGGGYGEGILSRFPFLSVAVHPLPAAKGYEPRALLEAKVRAGKGGPLVLFFGTHLDHLSDTQRIAQAKVINRIARSLEGIPMILAGDLNASPGSPVMAEFFKEWTPAALQAGPTFPADKPGRKIDWVLFRPARRWRVLQARVVREPVASDHRPLQVVLELLPPGGRAGR